jgi:hypothetical protein
MRKSKTISNQTAIIERQMAVMSETQRIIMAEQKEFIDELLVDLARLREHSILLNRVAWKIAVALGDAGPEDDQVEGDVMEQLDRLLAERQEVGA